jgi:Transglutaminase-like superfamily
MATRRAPSALARFAQPRLSPTIRRFMLQTIQHRVTSDEAIQPSREDTPFHFLAPHVFIADVGRQTIFLDLRTDKYQGVDSQSFWSLAAYFDGGKRDEPLTGRQQQMLRWLTEKGLLTTVASQGKPVHQILHAPAKRQLPRTISLNGLQRLAWVARLFGTAMRADRQLRAHPIQDCVERIRTAKAQCRPADPDQVPPWLSYVLHARFYYPADAICLRDSFLLMKLLTKHGVSADWVFGVKTDPFEAHCWVQIGDLVVNDDCERTSRFHPILVV